MIYYPIDADKVRLLATRQCLGLVELSRKADVAQVTFFKAMSGRPVRTKTAGKIARALGVDVLDIIKTD